MLFLKRVIKHIFLISFLLVSRKSVSLHCVFHSIRFKVNKRLEYGGTPFFMSILLCTFAPV